MIKPIDFRGTNIAFADDQDEYNSIPAIRTDDGIVYTCWQLDASSLKELQENGGKIYLQVHTCNTPLQALKMMTDLADDVELSKEGD